MSPNLSRSLLLRARAMKYSLIWLMRETRSRPKRTHSVVADTQDSRSGDERHDRDKYENYELQDREHTTLRVYSTRRRSGRFASPGPAPLVLFLFDGVFHIAGGLAGGTFRLIDLAFSFELVITGRFAGGFLGLAFSVFQGAFHMFFIHDDLLF